jgi:hypothetical protein
VILVTFLECRPFSLWWRLTFPPPSCTDAYAQLLLQAFSNIFLDSTVLVISLPLLDWRHRKVSQNVRVGILFFWGTICVFVTCVRVAQVLKGQSSQATRSL